MLYVEKTIIKREELIIIPAYFYKAMLRNSLSLDDILDLDKINDLFSLEDLVYIYLTNEVNELIIPSLSKDSSFNYLKQFWINSQYFEKILDVKSIYKNNLKTMLSTTNVDDNKPYELRQDAQNAVFCILNPSYFTTDNSCRDLVTDFLKLLYGYNSYNLIARHVLFRTYLDFFKVC